LEFEFDLVPAVFVINYR